ncbi:MAG: undecaprenyl-phosphate glucose phosphotransferase [Candidatus Obscuribacterales bacterium]|nr:undecaprenyl-phosphate glucose phosphotransferase [Steroidobacteraceae bacterium]
MPAKSTVRHSALPHRNVKIASVDQPGVFVITRLLNPLLVLFVLWGCMLLYSQQPSMHYLNLSILAFIVSAWLLPEPERNPYLRARSLAATRLIFMKWCLVFAVLLLVAFATKTSEIFSRKVLLTWFALTPVVLVGANAFAWRVTTWMGTAGLVTRTHIIIGATLPGVELAQRLVDNPAMGTFIGYFDDAGIGGAPKRGRLLGGLDDVAAYVRRNCISAVYIALPTIAQPRVQRLLSELGDTTASIYFVPDISSCDLMQARIVALDGLPLVALRETPFCGIDGIVKRGFDVVASSFILAVIWPLLLLIAIAVKIGSPGPAIFKQRRYGMDGEEFFVFKFRTMTVCEDGDEVKQAQRGDARVTPLGGVLRKFSLDELPQVLNVLSGTMSLVGPRPHAVAHNEQYRKLIHGYMLRHKVRPGITGWAQVNGLRGETDTIEKMEQRVAYDLDYVCRWSVWLDIGILCRTVLMIFHDKRAY